MILASVLFAQCSCEEERRRVEHKVIPRERLAELNRWMVQNDSIMIVHMCDSLGLDSIPDGRGIWRTIYYFGDPNAMAVDLKSRVSLSYVISDFLSCDTFYITKRNGVKEFDIVQNDEPLGLVEAIEGLHKGARGTVVLMPDKGCGLVGDGERIRGRKIIRYDFELLDVKRVLN